LILQAFGPQRVSFIPIDHETISFVAGRETHGYIGPVRRIVAENDLPLDQFPRLHGQGVDPRSDRPRERRSDRLVAAPEGIRTTRLLWWKLDGREENRQAMRRI
jgi:hypothetical protein